MELTNDAFFHQNIFQGGNIIPVKDGNFFLTLTPAVKNIWNAPGCSVFEANIVSPVRSEFSAVGEIGGLYIFRLFLTFIGILLVIE